jgi:hypothetical protein
MLQRIPRTFTTFEVPHRSTLDIPSSLSTESCHDKLVRTLDGGEIGAIGRYYDWRTYSVTFRLGTT